MIGLVLVVFMLAFMALGGLGFLFWIIVLSHQASMYRKGQKLTTKPADGNSWKVVYRNGRTTTSVTVDGSTEGMALKELMKKGITMDKILSMEKI